MSEQIREARQTASDYVKKKLTEVVTYERLETAGNTVVLSYHRTYSDYVKFLGSKYEYSFVNVDNVHSYIIDLNDKMRGIFRPLTLSTLANDLLEDQNEKKVAE